MGPVVLNEADLKPGRFVTFNMASGDKIAGYVFAVDAPLVTLEQTSEHSTTKTDVQLVNMQYIQSFELGQESEPTSLKVLPRAQLEKLALAREAESVKKATAAKARIGKDVTPEGQHLFNMLSRTLDCRWEGQVIEELKLGIRITPPYSTNNVQGADKAAVARVQQMITMILQQNGP